MSGEPVLNEFNATDGTETDEAIDLPVGSKLLYVALLARQTSGPAYAVISVSDKTTGSFKFIMPLTKGWFALTTNDMRPPLKWQGVQNLSSSIRSQVNVEVINNTGADIRCTLSVIFEESGKGNK